MIIFFFLFFFSDRVKNESCKLLQWIIHSLIISLPSSLSSIYRVYKSKEPSFFMAECLVFFLSVSKHRFLCCNPLPLLSRTFPVSSLSSFLFIMVPFYVSPRNSISKDFKISFRSPAMFQGLGRWTALSSLSPEIHILPICQLYPFEVCQVDFNNPFHLSNNTQTK